MNKRYSRSYFEQNQGAAIVIILNTFLAFFAVGWAIVEAWQFHWMHAVRLFLTYVVGCTLTQVFVYVHWVIGFVILFATAFILFHTGG